MRTASNNSLNILFFYNFHLSMNVNQRSNLYSKISTTTCCFMYSNMLCYISMFCTLLQNLQHKNLKMVPICSCSITPQLQENVLSSSYSEGFVLQDGTQKSHPSLFTCLYARVAFSCATMCLPGAASRMFLAADAVKILKYQHHAN